GWRFAWGRATGAGGGGRGGEERRIASQSRRLGAPPRGSGHRMMDRRGFLAGAVPLLARPLAGEAQRAGKVWRVGILYSVSPASDIVGPNANSRSARALLQGLRELGYVYGQNLITEPPSAEGAPERLPALATELVRSPVD